MQEADKLRLQQQLKDALVAIKKLKSNLQSEKEKKHEPIAVIGMAMRLPGHVKNTDDFWKLLSEKQDAVTDIPQSRFDAQSLYDENYDTPGKMVVRQGGYLDEIDQFDGSFFDISYAELESMDPQQRLLLEITHEAAENAGIPVHSLIGSNTGVFVGVTNNDYQKRHFRSGDLTLINPYSYTGIAQSAHSGRLSYLMGLEGPSVSLDTACSSSLVATHLACQSLRNRECNLAVVGAANLIIDPEFTIYFSTLNALSKDSRCKSFSNEANGFIRSEGAGVLILKRLSDAQKDGDNILAVVKGSAVNQDGRSNGFTAPNVKAQEKLLRQALKNAGLKPEQIAFIEAHGTGTKIGDPIEMDAITSVYAQYKSKEKPLLVGSVKTNIGHTESAAGVAGIMKSIMAVQKGVIPGNLHFKTPNELIDWDNIPVQVPIENTGWNSPEEYIGVSGFGVTGTNAHVIIGAAPKQERETENISLRKDVFVLPLSARTEEALQALAKAYAAFIGLSSEPLEDICAMTALRRSPFEIRKVFVAKDKESMIETLNDFAELELEDEKRFDSEDTVKVAFVCPGQGAQWAGMARQLYQSEPAFKEAMDKCTQAYSKIVSWNLIEELSGDNFEQIDIIQPVLVAVEIALGELWQSKGIRPDIVIGHSMGEIAAAYLARMISIEDAAQIICTRSSLMKGTSGKGAMAVTDWTLEEAWEGLKGLEEYLSVAVQNSPNSTVISGNPEKLKEIHDKLESEGRFCRMIKVDVASHSPQMDELLQPLGVALNSLQPQNSNVVFYSTALNQKVNGEELNAEYWKKNLRNPVQFGATVRDILSKDKVVFIELSPHPVLTSSIQENIEFSKKIGKAIPSLWREKDELVSFYNAYGAYWEIGLQQDWTNIYPDINTFILLPNYQWQKERFWFDEQPHIALSQEIVKEQLPISDKKTDESSFKDIFYEVEWEETVIQQADLPQSVTVVMDAEGLGEKVAELLKQKGVQVETILPSEKPDEIPEVVMHLACTNVKASQLDAIYSIKNLVQFFTDKGHSPKLYTVTKNGQIVGDNDKHIHVPSSILWGMMRTVRNEHPEFKAVTIDINSLASPQDILNVLGQNEEIKEWAFRVQKWHTPVLNKIHVQKHEIGPFNDQHTYLISGGTSGLGLVFAEWLASKGVKNLALVSRTGLKPETPPVIERLNAQGVRAEVFSSDISNLDELSKLVLKIESVLPTIKGVVHAAGVLDDAPFLNLTAEQFNKVLAPKLNGGWNLHQYFSGRSLESFVLFSSGASILGTAAQANYSAANMAMDQLANYRKSLGQSALSINFGNIGGIGLAAADDKRGAALKEQGMNTIAPESLPAYFEALFDLPGAQYVLMDIDFNRWSELNSNVKNNYFFSKVMTETSASSQEESLSEKKFTSKTSAIRYFRGFLKNLISGITKIPAAKIKEDATFKSLGIDSLMAVQLKNKLQTETNLNIAVSSIWTYPTIEKYAEFIVGELSLEDESAGEKTVETAGNAYTNRASALRHFKTKLKAHLSAITKIPTAKIKEDATFKSLGVDSLMAVQLKNKFQTEFELNIAVSSIWAHPTVEKYSEFLADELKIESEESRIEEINLSGNTTQAPKESDIPTLGEIEKEVDQMSLDDLLDALDEE